MSSRTQHTTSPGPTSVADPPPARGANPATTITTIPSARVPALEACRAGAMLLGVVLHAAAPYMRVPMRDLVMPMQQPASSRWLDWLFWSIHLFRVPLFFIIAGWVAHALLQRKGRAEFLRNRWRRIALPLLIAYPLVHVAMYPIWGWGWVERGWAAWEHLPHFRFGPDIQHNFWGLGHLWFLQYLFIYSLGLWAVTNFWTTASHRAITSQRATNNCHSRKDYPSSSHRRSPFRWACPLPDLHPPSASPATLTDQVPSSAPPATTPMVILGLLFVPGVLLLAGDAGWLLNFRNSFWPDPAAFLYYAGFFVLGLAIARAGATAIDWLTRAAPVFMLTGLAAAIPAIASLMQHVDATPHGPRQGIPPSWSTSAFQFAVPACIAAGALSLGILGLVFKLVGNRRLGNKPSTTTALGPMADFLSRSSYWVYLTHLPFVGLGVMLLHAIDGSGGVGGESRFGPEFRAVLVALFATAVSLATYVMRLASRSVKPRAAS